jgi:hypothetical protein
MLEWVLDQSLSPHHLNPMKTHENDPLDSLLASWQVRGEAPMGFQREVWNCISAGEGELAWWERFSIGLLRPLSLGCAAAAAVAVGAFVAVLETRPSSQTPHDAYVQSVSPFASVHLASH